MPTNIVLVVASKQCVVGVPRSVLSRDFSCPSGTEEECGRREGGSYKLMVKKGKD